MFNAPVKPSLRSSRDFLISPNNIFILSTSYKQTTMNGVFSFILATMSSQGKSIGHLYL